MKTKILLLTSLALTSNLAWGAAAEVGALARSATRVASRASLVSLARPVLLLATRPFAVEVFPVSPFPVRAFSASVSPHDAFRRESETSKRVTLPEESTHSDTESEKIFEEKLKKMLESHDRSKPILENVRIVADFMGDSKLGYEILRKKVETNCVGELDFLAERYPEDQKVISALKLEIEKLGQTIDDPREHYSVSHEHLFGLRNLFIKLIVDKKLVSEDGRLVDGIEEKVSGSLTNIFLYFSRAFAELNASFRR
jgi:hypothetical protein